MFRNTRINTIDTKNANPYIIYYININDYENFINLINNDNINNIIDLNNGYTALHYAIEKGRDKMIKFLLEKGVSLDAKTSNGIDLFQFSVQNKNMSLINFRNDKDKNSISDLQKNNNYLQRRLNTSEANNKFLTKSNDDYLNKYNIVKNENLKLEKEIIKANSELSNIKTENLEVKSENKSIKRKYENLEKSYDGLLINIKKQKI